MKILVSLMLISLLLYGCDNDTDTLSDSEIEKRNEEIHKSNVEKINNLKNTMKADTDSLMFATTEIENVVKEIEMKYVEFLNITMEYYKDSLYSLDEYVDIGILKTEEISQILKKLDLISTDGYLLEEAPDAIKAAKKQVELMGISYNRAILANANVHLYKDYTNKEYQLYDEQAREYAIQAIAPLKAMSEIYSESTDGF